jgi:hypothetical protein
MKLGIAEILEHASRLPTEAAQIEFLRKNDSTVLRTIVASALDPRVIWALPPGNPPYKPNKYLDQESGLYNETKRLYLFIQGGHPSLSQTKRENLYIQFLEMLNEADAALMLAAKEKRIPYSNLTPELFNKAFPGLLLIVEKPSEPKHVPEKRVKKVVLTPKATKAAVKKDVPSTKDAGFSEPVTSNIIEVQEDLTPITLPPVTVSKEELERLQEEAMIEILR